MKMLNERFHEKWIRTDSGCLEWTGSKDKRGYGRISVLGINNMAHRVAWFLSEGEWPASGMYICHHCDNPACVNPNHLFVGTQYDNMQDCIRKGRHGGGKNAPKGEMHGQAKLTSRDIQFIRNNSSELGDKAKHARYFSVSASLISKICNMRAWSHV